MSTTTLQSRTAPSALPATRERPEGPTPIRPLRGRPTDASAATFVWTREDQADAYRLQVARDEDFRLLLFDAPVGDSGDVTLLGHLPASGETMYWRVAGLAPGAETSDDEAWGAFGPAATFQAVTDDEAMAFDEQEREKALAEAQAEAERRQAMAAEIAEQEAPHRTAQTSASAVIAFSGLLLLTCAVLALLIILAPVA